MSVQLSTSTKARLLFLAARNAGTLRLLGDTPGHEFHGNQWTEGGAGSSFSVPENFKWSDAQYDRDSKFPRDKMVVASVDLDLLSSPYPNDWRVQQMVGAIKQGAKFPPITLDQYPDKLVIADGSTRVAAFREAGIKGKVPAVIRLYGDGSPLPKGVTVDEKRTKSLRAAVRALGARESAIHVAADQHLSKVKIAVMYAFLTGRKAYRSGGISAATAAVKYGLLKSLPAALLPCFVAGANVGIKRITAALKTAGDVSGHEFHGNQYTDAIDAMPAHTTPEFGTSDSVKNPLHSDQIDAHAKESDKFVEYEQGEVKPSTDGAYKTVPISSIDSRQESLSKDKLKSLVTRTNFHGRPTVVEYGNGRHLLIDGNHQLVARKLRGETTAKVKVVKFVAAALKTAGDVEGHEFHGNQWTSGSTVYHGSTKDFDKFDVAKVGTTSDEGWLGQGTYFSTDNTVARYYPLAYEAKVTLENPLKIEMKNFKEDKRELVREALGLPKTAPVSAVTRELKKRGHDGVVLDMRPTGYNAHEVMALHNSSMSISRKYETGNNKMWDSWHKRPESVKKRGYLVDKEGRQLEGLISGLRVAERFEVELRTAKTDPKPIVAPLKIKFNVEDPNAVKWAERHAAELAKDLSETTEKDIQRAVSRMFSGDIEFDEAYDEILDAVGDEARAELIARTETMIAASEGQRAAWDEAVDKGLLDKDSERVWITTPGCCDECEALDGETATLDGEYPDPGGEGPPLHPNSIVGSVIVAGNTEAATRMSYAGQVREIVTASGRTLTVTPNHAVATLRGFIPARDVEKGEYLLAYDERFESDSVSVVTGRSLVPLVPENEQHGPAEIEQIFRSLQLVGKLVVAERFGDEFHGDAAYGDGDIDVVYADIELGNRIEAALLNQGNSLGFKKSDRSALALGTSLLLLDRLPVAGSAFVPTLRSSVEPTQMGGIRCSAHLSTALLEPRSESTTSDVSFERQLEQRFSSPVTQKQTVDDLGSKSRSLTTFQVGRTSKLDAALLELQGNTRSRDASFVRELEQRLSSLVARDEVVEVRDRDHFGHVYDLSTVSGVIVAEGLIISNCRCTEGIVS